jgi:hypothetical protein
VGIAWELGPTDVHEKEETPQTHWLAAFLKLPRLDSNQDKESQKRVQARYCFRLKSLKTTFFMGSS